MKTRNNSSKAFHNSQIACGKLKSFSNLVDRITAKIDTSKDQKLAIAAFKEIVERCYNNKTAQQELCEAMNVPFFPGPVSLNMIPYTFFEQQYLSPEDVQANVMNQINYLFEYLKKTKQYFYCWIIYYNEELKLLTVKMMKKYELKENIELLNSKHCLIGIFVDRQVNLSTKKQSFVQDSTKKNQKLSAYSCYQQSEKMFSQKALKTKNALKKNVCKITNSESVYSLKSLKSASKTNSSSFKNQKSSKESELQSEHNPLSEIISSQKPKNFKKKKEKLILFAETKIFKSISSKFETTKSPVNIIKSVEKIDFKVKKNSPINFKSQQKPCIFRSISNTQKMRKDMKGPQMIDSNKRQVQSCKKALKQGQNFEVVPKKRPSLTKNKSLSKSSKVYSSCGSLNVTTDSKAMFMKEPEEKICTNFIKRKISSNISSSFKKKKLAPTSIKWSTSSKNSFNIE